MLILSERFGFLLAENLDEVGSPESVVSENISMNLSIQYACMHGNNFVWFLR